MALRFWIQAGLGILLGTLFIVVIFALDLIVSDPRSSPQIEVFALPIAYLFRTSGMAFAQSEIPERRTAASCIASRKYPLQ